MENRARAEDRRRAQTALPVTSSRLAAGLALALALLFSATAARAGIFTVDGVEMAVAANSPSEARAQARDGALSKAWRILAERLIVPGEEDVIPSLPPPQIAALVASENLVEEPLGQNAFGGIYSFEFRPDAVRRKIADLGLDYTETRSRPYVVVPVFGEEVRAELWQSNNPWREAWASYPGVDDGLVPLVVPLGDLSDLVAIDANRALAGDLRGYGQLAGLHGAAGGLLAHAVESGDPARGTGGLSIHLKTYGQPLSEGERYRVDQQPGEDAESFYARAVVEAVAKVERDWKTLNATPLADAGQLSVRVLAGSFPDWLTIRRGLEQEPLVESVQMGRLAKGQIDITIAYRGTREQLARALAQRGLILQQSAQAAGGTTGQGGGQGAGQGLELILSPTGAVRVDGRPLVLEN